MIIDRKTPPAERAAMLIEALAGFDTDAMFLPPQVRDALAVEADRAAEKDEPKRPMSDFLILSIAEGGGSSATALLASAARTRGTAAGAPGAGLARR